MNGAKILLVEDSPTYAKLATLLLKGRGHEVLRAATAEEGLRLAHDEHPDLILMDLQLPDLNGFEAVRRLRADPDAAAAAIPTVGLTADRISNPTERERAAAAGFDALAEKPVSDADFGGLIEPFVGGTDASREDR